MENDSLNIYQIISKISAEAGALAPEAKNGVPFAFRGVDAVVNHLAPLLREYGVITVPEVLEHRVTSRDLPQNKALTQSEVLVAFHFYAPDGTQVIATTAGLAQDYADRSTAQAQSVAYRVALLQTFTLPTTDKDPEERGEDNAKFVADLTANEEKNSKGSNPKPATETVDSVRALIGKIIHDETNDWDSDRINEFGDKITKKDRKVWFDSVADLKTVHEALLKEIAKAAK